VLVIAYLPALQGDFVWDDDDYVSANPTLRTTEGLRAIWLDPTATPQYYPLVHTSYWLEYRLWGLAPAGYHVTNLALHAAATVVLWRVLLLLGISGAPLVAAIFAVHPVHVESVAWITERKNVLSGVLYLSGMLAYLHLALDTPAGQGRLRQYIVAFSFFVLALLSKTVTATLPAALLVLIVWKRGRLWWRDVWPLLPLFAVGLTMGLVTEWLERHHVGAQGIDWQLSALQRVEIAGRALWFYATKLIWPTNLTFVYPRWSIDAADPRQLAYPVAAVATVIALWLARRKIGSGALVAVLLFAGTLFPALGFFDTFPMRYSFVADHFQYLASIALIALAVGAVARLTRDRAHDNAARGVGMLVVLVLAALTWRQSHAYADHESLWNDTIRKDPASWMGHTSLGALLGQRGAQAEAEIHYREAVRLNPEFAIARTNLGGLLANAGRFAEAIPHFRADVRLEPASLQARISLGRALLLNGQIDEAVIWLRAAVDAWPDDAGARAFLDQALAVQRQQSGSR
jgi:tetratricopeptide (TPR) repeat protein